MIYDKKYYEEKLKKLQTKNNQILQNYVNVGIQFGIDIAYLQDEIKETQQMIEGFIIKEAETNDEKIATVRE
jgi:hypothetical protein